jgi:hypothetical protein
MTANRHSSALRLGEGSVHKGSTGRTQKGETAWRCFGSLRDWTIESVNDNDGPLAIAIQRPSRRSRYDAQVIMAATTGSGTERASGRWPPSVLLAVSSFSFVSIFFVFFAVFDCIYVFAVPMLPALAMLGRAVTLLAAVPILPSVHILCLPAPVSNHKQRSLWQLSKS